MHRTITTTAALLTWLNHKCQEQATMLARLDAARADDQLHHFLSWNALTLLGTTTHDVCARQVLGWIGTYKHGQTEADCLRIVRDEVMREVLRARRVESRSTLASANYDEDFQLQFWAELAASIADL